MNAVLQEYKSLRMPTPPYQPALLSHVINYKELLLNWHVVGAKQEALFYRFRSASCKEDCKVTIVPDACASILFECCPIEPRAMLYGISNRPMELELKPDVDYFVFKPYSSRGFVAEKLPLLELVNSSANLLDSLPAAEPLLEELVKAQSLEKSIRLFDKYLKNEIIDLNYKTDFVGIFTLLLCKTRGSINLSEMERLSGFSSRYCREQFKAEHGISPKQYGSIMRFQQTLKDLVGHTAGHSAEHTAGHSDSLTMLAANNGYFDQAHFIHDFKSYTNQTPGRFRREHLR